MRSSHCATLNCTKGKWFLMISDLSIKKWKNKDHFWHFKDHNSQAKQENSIYCSHFNWSSFSNFKIAEFLFQNSVSYLFFPIFSLFWVYSQFYQIGSVNIVLTVFHTKKGLENLFLWEIEIILDHKIFDSPE